jgi:precorrin-6A synthase
VKRIVVIGIGAGDPEYLTLQAVKALNQADVFFILDKGREKHDLIRLRHDILERHVVDPSYRLVETSDADRDRANPDYAEAVSDWRRRRADIYEQLIGDELGNGECGAFLVWGDPAFYDSTLGILEEVLARGTVAFDYEVIPGISCISALAAKHRTGLNHIGRPVQITTGRRLAEGFPQGVDDLVVLLDTGPALTQLADHHADQDLEIYWGAYVGTADEILIAGRLADVWRRIETLRSQARERKGWIMDTYLLRRNTTTHTTRGGG